ncbi:Immunoglobulin-binding regulator A-like protein [Escherichia coli]|uniref:Immunoglobulin-binding regulator A-like protein n=1 Tax=Escherichia coli TaxID=562 RepID=A0A376L3I5_ECOLX|nr:Immunoglobulin-binding regulator A-like protein [Escherichia coli]
MRCFLLDVMPERTAEHYRNKIAVYLRWYQTRGFPDDIPDEQENDLGSRIFRPGGVSVRHL